MMGEIYMNAKEVVMWLGEPHLSEHSVGEEKINLESFTDMSRPSTHTGLNHHVPAPWPLDRFGFIHPGGLGSVDWDKKFDDMDIGDQKAISDAILEMRTSMFGTASSFRVEVTVMSPTAQYILGQIMESWNIQDKMERQVQDAYSEIGERALEFDWTRKECIPKFFRGVGKDWPILGAFCILYSFAHNKHFGQLPFFKDKSDLSFHMSHSWRASARALEDILELPYWRRAWTLQEMVLAQKAKVYYGLFIMPFDMFLKAQELYEMHYETCCAQWGGSSARNEHSWWSAIRDGLYPLERIKRLKKAHFRNTDEKSQSRWTITDLLVEGMGDQKATNPLDHIYSVLGLIADIGKSQIVPDYSLTVQELFAKVTAKIIHDDESLRILGVNTFGYKSKFELPSWTPDWACRASSNCASCPIDLFHSSKDQPYFAKLQNDLSLRIRSVKADIVSGIGPSTTPSHFSRIGQVFLAWRALAVLKFHRRAPVEGHDFPSCSPSALVSCLREWRQLIELEEYKVEKQPQDRGLEKEFWRTVFVDSCSNPGGVIPVRRLKNEDLEEILKWWDWLQTESQTFHRSDWKSFYNSSLHPEFNTIWHDFGISTQERRFFLTKMRRFGNGPAIVSTNQNVQVGDEIHVAYVWKSITSDFATMQTPTKSRSGCDNLTQGWARAGNQR
jgi:Heterokaryon incompatibility protein (HET)